MGRNWVNLDIRDLPDVVQCDVSDPVAMSEYHGATEILAYDILEHFPREEARRVLKMWVDLLAPFGVIRIRCPDFRHAASLPKSDEWVERLLYGGQDYPENQHKCGFTVEMMKCLLNKAGLNVVKSILTEAGNMEVWARK